MPKPMTDEQRSTWFDPKALDRARGRPQRVSRHRRDIGRASRTSKPGELLAAHVSRLCRANGIAVEHRDEGGRAFKKERLVQIPHVQNVETYFTALHEIGHIAHPSGSGKGLRLEQEYHAWAWAIENAEVAPTLQVRQLIHRSLTSYVKKAGRSQRMRVPDSAHPFWAMLSDTR